MLIQVYKYLFENSFSGEQIHYQIKPDLHKYKLHLSSFTNDNFVRPAGGRKTPTAEGKLRFSVFDNFIK